MGAELRERPAINVAEIMDAVAEVKTPREAEALYKRIKIADHAARQFKAGEELIGEIRIAQVLLLWKMANALTGEVRLMGHAARCCKLLMGVPIEAVYAIKPDVFEWVDKFDEAPGYTAIAEMVALSAGVEEAAPKVAGRLSKAMDDKHREASRGANRFGRADFDAKFGEGSFDAFAAGKRDQARKAEAASEAASDAKYVSEGEVLKALFADPLRFDGMDVEDAIEAVLNDREGWHWWTNEPRVIQLISLKRWEGITPFDVDRLLTLEDGVLRAIKTVDDLRALVLRQEHQIAATTARCDLVKTAIQICESTGVTDLSALHALKGRMLDAATNQAA